ncbi:Hypothetical predicted protein [Octopus vulgaris]|uniref:Uncharacterized protein n=1 Tax=Octopus vulgaris TaxID=6645 RepID=A0AA36BM21_OCTVU|nr:Hypothetical predicted protein [Octopus vulgaris]
MSYHRNENAVIVASAVYSGGGRGGVGSAVCVVAPDVHNSTLQWPSYLTKKNGEYCSTVRLSSSTLYLVNVKPLFRGR